MLELQLAKIPIIEQSGFLFISLKNTQSAEFEIASSELFQMINPFEPASLKLAAYRDFLAKANWLLFLQNFLECYHCHSSHQLLRRSEAFIDLYEEGQLWKSIALDSETRKRAIANGKPYVNKECDSSSTIFWSAQSSTLLTDSETVSGNLVGCELGNFSSDDRSFIYGTIGPFNHFTILPDQIVFFRFMPVSDAETHARIYWFVHQDTQLNESSLEDMMGFWIQTLNEDIELTEAVQLNSTSQFMMPSIFLQYEQNAKRLTNWVKNQFTK